MCYQYFSYNFLHFVLGITLLCGQCIWKISSKTIYTSPGHLNIGYILEQCDNITLTQKSAIHSVIWTIQRINDLNPGQSLKDLNLGITVEQVCSEEDYLTSIFELYKENKANNGKETFLLGVIIDPRAKVPRVVPEFMDLLNVELLLGTFHWQEMTRAAAKVLEALEWSDDIEIVAPDQQIIKEFYRITRRDWMCVNRFHTHESFVYDISEDAQTHPLVFLGLAEDIYRSYQKVLTSDNGTEDVTPEKILMVPFDSLQPFDIRTISKGLILQPNLSEEEEPYTPPKILPSSLLLEMADPIIRLTRNISLAHCSTNETSNNLKCIKNHVEDQGLTFEQILDHLKLDALSSEFFYKVQNSSYSTTFMTYSFLDDNITLIDPPQDFQLKKRNISASSCFKEFDRCLLECENFKTFEVTNIFTTYAFPYAINLRPEPWVYAFFSLSLLGILFCLSIMTFIINRLCKKQVLEGNPILTILLLIDVIIIFASVLPFAIEGNKSTRYEIYILRALCVTIPYAFAFALLLSRTILLATVSKEVGFMSHVAGTVQAFLALFIFAVQCALCLQLTGACADVFRDGYSLLSLMSYNAALLTLLVFIAPLVAKSKRNYREGKHFTIAIVMLACAWSCWLPSYAVLDEAWKDPLLCMGLVSTGSIILGSIFIPRTYMMTVSAARERFTSALPSLATATSAMDIYRASTQPVYDCVNVAAIAAANLRAQHEQERRHAADFYAAPNDVEEEEDDDEFDVQACDSPPIDKVTRF